MMTATAAARKPFQIHAVPDSPAVIGGDYVTPPDDLSISPAHWIDAVHGASHGSILLTKQTRRLDGTEGAPWHRFFPDLKSWRAEASSHVGEVGWFWCASTFKRADSEKLCATTNNLWDLTALWSDLDWHKIPVLVARYGSADRVLDAVDRRCDEWGVPRPNAAVFSGRGLQVLWVMDRVPAYGRAKPPERLRKGEAPGSRYEGGLVRWTVVQGAIHEMLSDLGADPLAKPPVHFFKVPGSVNPKSGRTVRILREPDGPKLSFSNLYQIWKPIIEARHAAGELRSVPLPRSERRQEIKTASAQVVDLKARRAMRTGKAASSDTADLIWSPRLAALVAWSEHLAEARGEIPAGQRDGVLFAIAVALSWITPGRWQAEAESLALRLTAGCWPEAECRKRFSAIAARVSKLQAGEKVAWDGVLVDPRYRMRTATVRGFAGISREDTQVHEFLRSLADPDVQRAWKAKALAETRRTTRHRSDRAAPTTGHTKAGYGLQRKSDLAEHIARAHLFRKDGLTTAEIARELGCSTRAVRGWLARAVPQMVTVPELEPKAASKPRVRKMPVILEAREAAQEAASPSEFQIQWLVLHDGYTVAQVAEDLHMAVAAVERIIAPLAEQWPDILADAGSTSVRPRRLQGIAA